MLRIPLAFFWILVHMVIVAELVLISKPIPAVAQLSRNRLIGVLLLIDTLLFVYVWLV